MKPIFGTNWKTQIGPRLCSRQWASELPFLDLLFVMPPTALVRDMADAVSDSRIAIGAQNAHWAKEGEFT